MFAIQSAKKLFFAFLILGGGIGLATTLTDEFEIAKNLELYSNVFRELNTYYVDEVPPEDLMKSGLDAMLKSLDPYTTYIPAQEVERFRSSITGSYAGIGTRVRATASGGLITAICPYPQN
ncbi:peptidase [Saprospira grandis]|uniref:C-terminal processing peptidase-3 n=1 Tax=Saprospira grandis (strain Lewin) TaxID=984262 RepID=H6L7P3_SAPGL|nr:peptidase [Saprospira grandis]AFC23075.1 C-terminal processing peptidase-3 [Saprospira grandis str. Lewin]